MPAVLVMMFLSVLVCMSVLYLNEGTLQVFYIKKVKIKTPRRCEVLWLVTGVAG